MPKAPVKPFDLERYYGKSKNRIYRVGVELEGGWKKVPEGVQLHPDGSVNVRGTGTEVVTAGELPSEILEPEKVPAWIRQFYPSHVNESCGLHVHMSLRNALHYQLLMVPEYQATMIEFLGKWAKQKGLGERHPIWKRLRGENQYCKLEFYADSQAAAPSKSYGRDRVGNRYTAINYCHGQHGTVECRVLPMMDDAETAVSAVEEVLRITNACLASQKRKEERLRASVNFTFEEGVREHDVVEVAPERILRTYGG